MNNRDIEDIYPLSPMQQGMLFHSIYAPETAVYLEQLNCRLLGPLDQEAFLRAWQEVVVRHPILRTSFMWEDLDEPLQIVHRQVDLPVKFHDFSQLEIDVQKEVLDGLLSQDLQDGFDLIEAPLMRLTLARLEEENHFFIWTHHHLLLDGWSMPVLLKEVFALYEAYSQGKNIYIRPARPYRDYIGWLKQQDLSKAETFWREYLQGFSAPTPLVISLNDPDRTAGVAMEKTSFNVELTQQLRRASQQIGVTLNSWFQGAWGLLLSRYSQETDVVFGATVAGRPASLPGIDTMLGLFINTLPVRVGVNEELSVKDWLKTLQVQQAETRQYEYSPLVQIQNWSEIPAGQPLFESILVFENYPVEESLKEQRGNLQIRDMRHFGKTNYPLTVVIAPGLALEIQLVYDPRSFNPDAIQRLLGHLRQILINMMVDVDQLVSQVKMLSQDEEELLLFTWNHQAEGEGVPAASSLLHHGLSLPQTDLSVIQLFEAQVALTPHAEAVILVKANGQVDKLTYQDLMIRVDELASELRHIGVGEEILVGLSFERSLEMIVAMFGVLKAGGAYVPLDPNYPADRLTFMLADAGIQLLLTQSHLLPGLVRSLGEALEKVHIICLDNEKLPTSEHEFISDACLSPQTAAYVIYTSGSTGQPKGVVIPHKALANHARSMTDAMELGPGKRMVQLISLSFDAAGEEIYPTLTSGATLVLPDASLEISGSSILGFLEANQVSVLHLPVPLWSTLVDEMPSYFPGMPSHLRVVLVGGESPSLERLRIWSQAAIQPMTFINAYGPTEATITTTYYKTILDPMVDPAVDLDLITPDLQIPIGKPVSNAKVYILDRAMRPAPVGVPGEIYIGGIGLARGYLNRPDLTRERFVPNPFARTDSSSPVNQVSLLYRTGDLGKYLSNGNIVFSGRTDNQVKLRGYRIELEEIDSFLNLAPGVKDGVVILREDLPGDKRLVAYLELTEDQQVDLEAVHSFMKKRLPDYMSPSWYEITSLLPRLPNGKIDRRAVAQMPAPDTSSLANTITIPPRDAIEEIIAGLWVEVLGIEFPGIYANFFELGGHSLKATQLLSRMRQTFAVELPLRSLFEAPSIAGMAEVVRAAVRGQEGEIQPISALPRDPNSGVPLTEPPLSFSQQRLWFLDQLDPGNLSYNIPAAVLIKGSLNQAALEESLNHIVQRHESLRTVFMMRDGRPVQVILPEVKIRITKENSVQLVVPPEINHPDENVSFSDEIQDWITSQVQIPFDLSVGPLIRAAILQIDEQNYVLIVIIHHIVSDGWSMGVLIGEIARLYTAYATGQDLTGIQPAELQYADFAAWQRSWLSGAELDRQLAYWKDTLAGLPPLLDLPTDRPRPAIKTSNGALATFNLSGDLSKAIQSQARQNGVTVYMFLLAAFQTLLYRYSGQEDICVGSAIANRTRPEVQGMIGFFVNTLVLRSDLSGDPSFSELLHRVRETALGAYAHQDLPFETLVETLQPQRNLSYTPLFQVGFDLQEVPSKDFELPGLRIAPLHAHARTAAFDMLMSINQSPARLSGSLEFNTDLFAPETIDRFLNHFEELLISIVADPDQAISSLSILTDQELNQILIEWDPGDTPFSKDRCIHQLFEIQAEQNPDTPALFYFGLKPSGIQAAASIQSLSYAELNRQANVLAKTLNSLGVGPDVLVGISTQRSIEMIVGILGILKAGGAYLPLDPNYPVDRLEFMLQDSQVQIILTQESVLERTGQLFQGHEVICLDSEWESSKRSLNAVGRGDTSLGQAVENPICLATPENLAYMIYTSGSTGKPKGTLLKHQGLCNLVEWQRQSFDIDLNSRVLQFSPFSFDASVWETFMALANGAALCLADQDILTNGIDLALLMKEAKITTVTLPPSVLSIIPEELVTVEALPDLRTVIAAGEACSKEIVSRWAPGRRFFDAYGPTETTVCASAALINPQDDGVPPIGRPIANFHLYVVDAHLQPVPVGVPGELLIGGVGLARGYHNRPELTAEKFIPHPLAAFLRKAGSLERARERLYRTGDLVRYRNDGNIEFLGRIDQQVKVRGYRIELGEIETALRQFSQSLPQRSDVDPSSLSVDELRLRDVAVVVREDHPGDKRLVAFIVPEMITSNSDVDITERQPEPALENPPIAEAELITELRKFLRQSLPEYMVPSSFVLLTALPLSPSGKIDRTALATQFSENIGREQMGVAYEAPRNETELLLCQICAELLGIPWTEERSPIGIRDNFFDLGGHSLMATQFISRIRDSFQVEIPLRTLFEQPTVAELSEKVEEMKQAGIGRQAPAIQPVSRDARRMRQTTAGFTSAATPPVNSTGLPQPPVVPNDEPTNVPDKS